MKHLLFLAFILSIGFAAAAQPSYHIKLGGQSSSWRGDGMYLLDRLTDITGDILKQGSYTSYYAGASVTLPIGERFSIEPGLQYSKVGTALTGNLAFKALSILGVQASVRTVTKRFELPVLAKAEVAKGLFIVAGPQVNYSLSEKLQIRAGVLGFNAINQKIDISGGFEPLSASALGGLQYQFPGGIQLQAVYEYGLTRITNNGSADIYQNNIRVGLGLPLNFLNGKKNESYY